MKHFFKYCLCIALIGAVSCNELNDPELPDNPGEASLPEFDYAITEWSGETSTDAGDDVAGSDAGFYHEANTFSNIVTITYDGSTATVENTNSKIECHITGAYVTVDMLTNSVASTEIVIKGKTDDGSLKIYGNKKFKLTMQGVELVSKKGPAINNQCKKSMFVHLATGTINSLTDASTYSADDYYNNTSVVEDRKGCFFSESNMLFSGAGVLKVAGKNNHAVVTDGLLFVRPGVTLVVTEAANNAIHVKGDANDNVGVKIDGGLIYANVASSAGKGIKCDLSVEVHGGQLLLNVSGDALYDSTTQDTSSAACIKTDANLIISGGTHVLKSTGSGGKGINADGEIAIKGGNTTVTTSGGEYIYSASVTSSPKAVKADGNITISGGMMNIAASGNSDGAEGLDSASSLFVSGGETYVYAYDDAVNITSSISVNGGKLYAYSNNNDGIDVNSTLTVTGGLVIGVGTSAPESGIDVDTSDKFVINGGTVIALGGALQSLPSSISTQCSVACSGMQVTADYNISVLDRNESPVLTFESPRGFNGASFFFSSPALSEGATYTINTGGSISDSSSDWNGWYEGGTLSGGTLWSIVTLNDIVTSATNS